MRRARGSRAMAAIVRVGLTGLAVLASLGGCAAPAPGPQLHEACMLRVWYRPDKALALAAPALTREQAERPEVIGSWDGFARPGLRQFERRRASTGIEWWTLSLPLPAGRYAYAVLVGDQLLLDDRSPQSAFGPNPLYLDSAPLEAEFTTVELPDCAAPTLTVEDVRSSAANAGGTVQLRARLLAGPEGPPLPDADVQAELRRGAEVLSAPAVRVVPQPDGSRIVEASASGLVAGKYTLTLRARPPGASSPLVAQASVFVEPSGPGPGDVAPPRALDDALIYQIMVDRFRGERGALAPPSAPGRRAGGSLTGVQAAIAAGYFAQLGVSTLWLSPLYQNPTGVFTGRDGQRYEAYHGYWPSEPRSVEPQLGGEAALDALVATAHAHGLRVIFDAVPNHLYQTHPYYRDHSRQAPAVMSAPDPAGASWFNDGPRACVCGSPGCGWGERIEDCWFDRYLPDVNWRHPEAADAGVADLLWWLERFDLDGMRIDAVPMMPRGATRRIVQRTHAATFRAGLDGLIIGETYTGPGDAGRAEIRTFLGAGYDGLDSAFDFPLMWAIRDALGSGRSTLVELEAQIKSSDGAFGGSGAVIAHILGNHDTPRFLSEAAGNAGNDPWRTPPAQPTEPGPYLRQALALALILTLPGVPVLYYGDEIGLAGANDPDSRRVLPDVLAPAQALSPPQQDVLATARTLGRLRGCLPVLRRGARVPVWTDADATVAVHALADTELAAKASVAAGPAAQPAIVVLARGTVDRRVPVTGLPKGRFRDALSADVLEITGETTWLTLRADRAAVFVAADSPCLMPPPSAQAAQTARQDLAAHAAAGRSNFAQAPEKRPLRGPGSTLH